MKLLTAGDALIGYLKKIIDVYFFVSKGEKSTLEVTRLKMRETGKSMSAKINVKMEFERRRS